MQFDRNKAAGSTGAMNRYACTGCDALTADPGCATVRLPAGSYAFVCAQCTARADDEPTFRRSVEFAAAAGQALPEVRRVFASLGVLTVPTTPRGFDAALGLPAGTTAALFGGGR